MTYFKAKRIARWQHYVYLPNGLFPIPAAIKKIRLFGAETDRGYLAYRKYNITWSFLECRAMVIPQMLERERLKKKQKGGRTMIISSQIISIWVLSLCLAFLAGWRWKNGD